MTTNELFTQIGQAQQASFESGAVQRILKTLIPAIDMARVKESYPVLTLGCVNALIDDFPLRLMAQRVDFVHQITVVDLFAAFRKSVVFRAYVDGLANCGWSEDDAEPTGLVFNWPQVGRAVLHNWQRGNHAHENVAANLRLVYHWRPAPNAAPVVYTIETLDALLAYLKAHCDGT